MNLLFLYFALSYFAVPVAILLSADWRHEYVQAGAIATVLMAISVLVWPAWILLLLAKSIKEAIQ